MFSLKTRVKLKYIFIFILGVLTIGPIGCTFISWNIEAAYFGNWTDETRIAYLCACIVYGVAVYSSGYTVELKKRSQDIL